MMSVPPVEPPLEMLMPMPIPAMMPPISTLSSLPLSIAKVLMILTGIRPGRKRSATEARMMA